MTTRMSKDEREAFLAEPHIGVVAIPEDGRGPFLRVREFVWGRGWPASGLRGSQAAGQPSQSARRRSKSL